MNVLLDKVPKGSKNDGERRIINNMGMRPIGFARPRHTPAHFTEHSTGTHPGEHGRHVTRSSKMKM